MNKGSPSKNIEIVATENNKPQHTVLRTNEIIVNFLYTLVTKINSLQKLIQSSVLP